MFLIMNFWLCFDLCDARPVARNTGSCHGLQTDMTTIHIRCYLISRKKNMQTLKLRHYFFMVWVSASETYWDDTLASVLIRNNNNNNLIHVSCSFFVVQIPCFCPQGRHDVDLYWITRLICKNVTRSWTWVLERHKVVSLIWGTG